MENMADTPPASRSFSDQVATSLKTNGIWPTYKRLLEYLATSPDNRFVFGTTEIVRNLIVRDLIGGPQGMALVPNLTPEFLSDFDRFDLTVQEGYLVSLVDGRLTIAKIMKLSPFDHFTTLFSLAALSSKGVITLPS